MVVNADKCNPPESYCGSSYIGITNINITSKSNGQYYVSADVFQNYVCSDEIFDCDKNGSVKLPMMVLIV